MTSKLSIGPLPIDQAELRRAYSCFPSGVTAVCALDDEEPVGIAASSFTSVSITPPLVSVCVAHSSTTWPRLRQLPRLGVSVLADGQEALCRSLAAKGRDRFADMPWEPSEDGAIFIRGAAAWLDCSVHSELTAGDHDIVLLQIHRLTADPRNEPLVFHSSRFRRLIALES
jgi:flavin reductase (DIM6/NTAB) family NADH-FMN oxidoreductase RutF